MSVGKPLQAKITCQSTAYLVNSIRCDRARGRAQRVRPRTALTSALFDSLVPECCLGLNLVKWRTVRGEGAGCEAAGSSGYEQGDIGHRPRLASQLPRVNSSM